MAKSCFLILLAGVLGIPTMAVATQPSEKLLPKTTKGFVSVPDVDRLRDGWSETDLGRLVDDPVMKPFAEDLRDQIKDKLSATRVRLGLTLDDLEGLYGGELCLASIQPENDETQHAMALLVDITGHNQKVAEMLAKVSKNLVEQGAVKRVEKIGGADASIFIMPKKRQDSPTVEALFTVHKDMLIATDHVKVCEQIINRLNGEAGESLADVEAFTATLERCASGSEEMQPHVRWFVEPFGYAFVLRAAAGGRNRRGADLLKVLPNQGFSAIQGVGGYIYLATGSEEILHRTMVYTPNAKRDPDGPRYSLAARMLDFPNNKNLEPQPFVSRDLASYLTFNWKMKEAFEYSKTLVNELMGADKNQDLLEEIIISLAKDKDGPQVDLRTDLVHHFAERASLVSDCRRPITTDSERLMVAIELTDAEAVRETINKAFDADPDAEKREFEGTIIWEIMSDDAPIEVEEIQIEGDIEVFDPFGDGAAPPPTEEERKIIPNSAITVANGHLLVASHVEFIVEMLQRPIGTELLADTADFQEIDHALTRIGAEECSFRFFTRTDEAYRPTYELIRQGKMPESKTVLGKLLNRFLGPDEKGILREQQIDGDKMPEFDAVRRYLGPSGMFVQSEAHGWFMAGCLLSKEMR